MNFLVNGKRVSTNARGEIGGAGVPVLVMVHGVGLTHRFWAPLFDDPRLRPFGMIAFDLPGHGESDGPAPTTIEESADWLIAAMESAGVRRAVLAGHSMGGLIAMEAARRVETAGHPTLQNLVLLGAAARMPVNPDLLNLARDAPDKAAELIGKLAFADPQAHAAARDEIVALQSRCASGVLHGDLAACDTYASGAETARAIRTPVTIIGGARDKMVAMAKSRELGGMFDDARVEEVTDVGHMMTHEATDMVASIMASVLET